MNKTLTNLYKKSKERKVDKSLAETTFLLKSPKMAKRLLNAVSDVKLGKICRHELIDKL